jgi:hypothetical protein
MKFSVQNGVIYVELPFSEIIDVATANVLTAPPMKRAYRKPKTPSRGALSGSKKKAKKAAVTKKVKQLSKGLKKAVRSAKKAVAVEKASKQHDKVSRKR